MSQFSSIELSRKEKEAEAGSSVEKKEPHRPAAPRNPNQANHHSRKNALNTPAGLYKGVASEQPKPPPQDIYDAEKGNLVLPEDTKEDAEQIEAEKKPLVPHTPPRKDTNHRRPLKARVTLAPRQGEGRGVVRERRLQKRQGASPYKAILEKGLCDLGTEEKENLEEISEADALKIKTEVEEAEEEAPEVSALKTSTLQAEEVKAAATAILQGCVSEVTDLIIHQP